MRYIKLAIISLVFFFLLFTLISLFIPSRVRVMRETAIVGSRQEIVEQLGKPVNWKNWLPVKDTAAFIYENGLILGIKPDSTHSIILTGQNDSTITALYMGASGRQSMMGWHVTASNHPGHLMVQWWMEFRLRWYPWEKFSSLIFEKQYGIFLETGLKRLKGFVEDN